MKTALPAFRMFPAAILSLTFAFSLIVPLLAFAEPSNESMLGLGLRSQPTYDGSASQRVEFVPVIHYLGKNWFARSTQGVLEGGGGDWSLLPGSTPERNLPTNQGARRANPISSKIIVSRMLTLERRSAFISNGTISWVPCRSQCSHALDKTSTQISAPRSISVSVQVYFAADAFPLAYLRRRHGQMRSRPGLSMILRVSSPPPLDYRRSRQEAGCYLQASDCSGRST